MGFVGGCKVAFVIVLILCIIILIAGAFDRSNTPLGTKIVSGSGILAIEFLMIGVPIILIGGVIGAAIGFITD